MSHHETEGAVTICHVTPPGDAQSEIHSAPIRDTALKIPLILENVLRYLDFKTLLLAQRVSSVFKEAISCKNLQKKLFFIPATFEEMIQLHMFEDATAPPDYTILQFRPAISNLDNAILRAVEFKAHAAPNPFMFKRAFESCGMILLSERYLGKAGSLQERPVAVPSWQRMMVSQPPPSRIYVGPHGSKTYTRSLEGSVTFERILQTMAEKVHYFNTNREVQGLSFEGTVISQYEFGQIWDRADAPRAKLRVGR